MRQRFSLVLFFLLCVFLPPGLSAQENSTPNWGYGPVEIFNHYPLSAVHASWTETSPEVLEEGQAQVRTSYSWGSTYATNQSYRIDAETRELRFEVDYGLTSRLEIGMDVPLFWRGGGVLDEAIDSWHDFFHLPDGGRSNVPTDQFFIGGFQDSFAPFRVENDGTTLGNIGLQSKYLLTSGDSIFPALSLEARVSLPTAKTNLGHDAIDTTLGVIASKRMGSFSLYGGAAWISFGDTEISQVRYERHHPELFTTLEYEVMRDWYLQTGIIWSGETINNISQHPDHAMYWDFSTAYQIDEQTAFEFLVRENISGGEGTIDVDFLLGLNHTFSLS